MMTTDLTGKYKWDAWKKNEGKSKEEAQKEYVDALLAILEKNKGKYFNSNRKAVLIF